MNALSKLPWPRIITESSIIVVSILLAFAIDAWWEQRSERRHEAMLLADLYEDFSASQGHLEIWLNGNRRVHDGTMQFLQAIRDSAPGQPVNARFHWIVAVIGTPTYSPTDASLRAALASGRIELLEDSELRKLLASWQQQLQDTEEDELLVRELVARALVPQLAELTRLGAPFEFEPHTGWFKGETTFDSRPDVVLTNATRLEGLLAQRAFYHSFVVSGLEELHATQSRILELIEAGNK